MEIQKIFSSWDGEERLYSVLMDEGELRSFAAPVSGLSKINFNTPLVRSSMRAAPPLTPGRIADRTKKVAIKGYNTARSMDGNAY